MTEQMHTHTPRELAKGFAAEMQCNCDLDNWQPEQTTGHSHVCRIHKAAISWRSGYPIPAALSQVQS